MPTFDFDAARRERLAKLDPVAFRLGGVTFKCKPTIPFESLILAMEAESKAKGAAARYRIGCEFVADCLLDPTKDRPRWQKVLTNRDEPVTEDDVDPVIQKLVQVYSARPTSPSPASSGGRRTTGASSNGKASGTSRTKAASRK